MRGDMLFIWVRIYSEYRVLQTKTTTTIDKRRKNILVFPTIILQSHPLDPNTPPMAPSGSAHAVPPSLPSVH